MQYHTIKDEEDRHKHDWLTYQRLARAMTRAVASAKDAWEALDDEQMPNFDPHAPPQDPSEEDLTIALLTSDPFFHADLAAEEERQMEQEGTTEQRSYGDARSTPYGLPHPFMGDDGNLTRFPQPGDYVSAEEGGVLPDLPAEAAGAAPAPRAFSPPPDEVALGRTLDPDDFTYDDE